LINSQHALNGVPAPRRIKVRTYVDGDNARFSVEDNGGGIPEEIRHRVFESYFTTKPAGVGTGIGLSISKSIVERHKGRVWFEPASPSGARFLVELPLASGTMAGVSAAATAASALRFAVIVDDEADVAGSLADILELMGVKARVDASYTSLDDLVAEQEPDILFSDLRMPGVGGMEIYRQILARRPHLARRFVLVTGDMIGARAEVDTLPVHLRPQILEKPFSTLDVRGVLGAIGDQVALTTG
ncbi:MAG: response regulator, partial [Hyphomicrobiales bacterium]|nr:response regulator [Hyphomicrobiales bacterium]